MLLDPWMMDIVKYVAIILLVGFAAYKVLEKAEGMGISLGGPGGDARRWG